MNVKLGLTLRYSDPIEAGAFAAVLGQGRSAANPIYIGSIKSNFG